MNKPQAKQLLKKTAKLMFPEYPKSEWTMTINEYYDRDFSINYSHAIGIWDISLVFIHNEFYFRLMYNGIFGYENVLLFEV